MELVLSISEQENIIQINFNEQQVSIPYSEIEVKKSAITDDVLLFMSNNINFEFGTEFINTVDPLEIISLDKNAPLNIVNFSRVNDARRVNKLFESLNYVLPEYGKLIGCVETLSHRNKRLQGNYKSFWKLAHFFDFILHRLFPKIPLLNKLYFSVTRGKNRAISKAEALGRLISCGFEITDIKYIQGKLYFAAIKSTNPKFDHNPTYGPFVKLARIGKDGKKFNLFKLRTMHPYSEYLQSYIFEENNLNSNGKFKEDYRITTWGRIFRKFWIDELPQFINLLRGDINLVGVRALSEHYFNLYPKDLQELRIKYKPGLVPPYYADMPNSFEEILESERRYFEQKEKNPVETDIRYFLRAFYNIAFKHARSQ